LRFDIDLKIPDIAVVTTTNCIIYNFPIAGSGKWFFLFTGLK